MAEEYKRHPNTKCFVCGKSIYKRPSVIRANKELVFCSRKCYGISCRIEIPCIVCGEAILAGLNKKTCSRKCSNIHRAGIKYKIGRPRDKAEQVRAIKLRLFRERGKECERCGYSKSEILQVHHKDRNRNNNNTQNLEIICPNCHYEEHYLETSWLKGRMG